MKPCLVRVRATYEFVGILPSGPTYKSPEEAVKDKFKYMGADISGFVLETKHLDVSSAEVELPPIPSLPEQTTKTQ